MELPSKLTAAGALVLLMAGPVGTRASAGADETTYGTVDPPAHRTGDTPTAADPTPRRADPEASVPGPAARGADDAQGTVGGEHDVPEPERTVREALAVFQQMRQEPQMRDALVQASGVFVIPGYATAALVVGGAGGSGIMLEQRDGQWSPPAFYHIGSASLGLQAGVAAGPLAMLLMNDDAVRPFHDLSNFSLDAAAGVTLVDWSALAEATAGRGDVVVWSDMTGLVVDLSVAVSTINFDEEATSRYYRQRVMSPSEVLAGEVEDPHGGRLQSEFAEFIETR